MLTVDITEFKSGTYYVELDPSAEDVNLDTDDFADIQVDAELQCHRDRILMRLDATATATLTCDRTLQRYDEDLDGSYAVLFGPEHLVGSESETFDEVRPLSRDDRELDVTDIVRDTLLLAIPQRTIAPGAEEEDIQMTFGAREDKGDAAADDEPVDPRWNELKKLKEG